MQTLNDISEAEYSLSKSLKKLLPNTVPAVNKIKDIMGVGCRIDVRYPNMELKLDDKGILLYWEEIEIRLWNRGENNIKCYFEGQAEYGLYNTYFLDMLETYWNFYYGQGTLHGTERRYEL